MQNRYIQEKKTQEDRLLKYEIQACFFQNWGNPPRLNCDKLLSSQVSGEEILKVLQHCYKEEQGNLYIDTEKVQYEFFKNYKGVIFISHSHKEKKLVPQIKATIQKSTGVSCFVDSEVWSNVYEIRDKIADKYALNGQKKFYYKDPYDLISRSTYFILLRALQEVIRYSCAFIYIDSDQVKGESDRDFTSSPWIGEELLTSYLMQPSQSMIKESKQQVPEFRYPAQISHLRKMQLEEFILEVQSLACDQKTVHRKRSSINSVPKFVL